MDKKSHVSSTEVIENGGPMDEKARVAGDWVFYNVRRRLTLSGADVNVRETGRFEKVVCDPSPLGG